MFPQWLKLADGTWLNMGLVVKVRKDPGGDLRIEYLGEQRPVSSHPLITDIADVALIEGFLARTQRPMPEIGPEGIYFGQ